MTPYLVAALVVALRTLIEDVQEANADRNWLADRWAYARNRWRSAYKNPEGPFRIRDYRLAVFLGYGAVIDLWHLAKTLRLVLVLAIVLDWAGVSLWFLPVAIALHGAVHFVAYDWAFRVWPSKSGDRLRLRGLSNSLGDTRRVMEASRIRNDRMQRLVKQVREAYYDD